MGELVVASFNSHWGVGRFGRSRAVRFDVADAVGGFDADVVVLQEAWHPHEGGGVLDVLAAQGWHVEERRFTTLRLGPRRQVEDPGDGWWSLSVLSRLPVLARRDIELAHAFRDPVPLRAAIVLTLDVGGTEVDVVGVHVSSKLWFGGPVVHLTSLHRRLEVGERPTVVVGDCNFWGPGVTTIMRGRRRAVRGRTYPAHRPHSQIDHVLVDDRVEVLHGEVLPPAGLSDHRPVRARLRV